MKHTKGPWTLGDSDGVYINVRGDDLIDGKRGTLASVLLTGNDFSEANAHLIAAAPEMLEALEMLQREVTTTGTVRNSVNAVNALNRAIAKAKGGA